MNRLTKHLSVLSFAVLILIGLTGSNAIAQGTITIPRGSSATIDGQISPGEWDDADTLYITLTGGVKYVTVLYKHDLDNLQVAYLGNLESANIRFPEILLDVNNDKSLGWLQDDWWFHVSATDCESQGSYGLYDSCSTTRPNWTAVNNIKAGQPKTDTVEIEIPFLTVGISQEATDTIGLSFEVTNGTSSWEYWPPNADYLQPITWGKAVFEQPVLSSNSHMDVINTFDFYPNPSNGVFKLNIPNHQDQENARVQILDLSGRLLYDENLSSDLTVNTDLESGTYLVTLQTKEGFYSQALLIW